MPLAIIKVYKDGDADPRLIGLHSPLGNLEDELADICGEEPGTYEIYELKATYTVKHVIQRTLD